MFQDFMNLGSFFMSYIESYSSVSYVGSYSSWNDNQETAPPESVLMERSGFNPIVDQSDSCEKKAEGIWQAYQAGAKKFIKALGKENKSAGDLCSNIECELLKILQDSILPYAFGNKGSFDTKDKQIKKIKEWLTKGLDIRFISPRINRVICGIRDLFSDILYWGVQLNAEGVKCIKLSNSDLHNRGLGVSFVTYITKKEGLFKADQTVVKVIKPEDKSLEKALLGKTESLAQKLNEKQISANGRNLNGNITTLDIQTSTDHGSMVEFFEGEQIDKLTNTGIRVEDTESDSKILTQIFASLTGMDDLHKENLTYRKRGGGGGYDPGMIDADNALSKRIFGKLKPSRSLNSGFEEGGLDIQTITGIDNNFIINYVKPCFVGKRGRTVPVNTSSLSKSRKDFWSYAPLEFVKGETWDIYLNYFINNIKEDERIRTKTNDQLDNSVEAGIIKYFLRILEGANPTDVMLAPGLKGVVGPADGTMTNEQKMIAARNALTDFQSGQIPFYEYDYSTGRVLSHNEEIWQGPNLDEIFSAEAVERMVANLNNPNG